MRERGKAKVRTAITYGPVVPGSAYPSPLSPLPQGARGTFHCTRRYFLHMAVALAIASTSVVAHALKSDAQQQIKIRANSVEASEKTGVSNYRGNVLMTRGTLKLEADRVEVTIRDGQTELVRAWGKPVRIQMRSDKGENLRARATRIEYRGNEQRIDLYGKVELTRDDDIFTGAVVHYALNDETFVAEGDNEGQVSAVLQPAKSTAKP